jgi:hypothetical protein
VRKRELVKEFERRHVRGENGNVIVGKVNVVYVGWVD